MAFALALQSVHDLPEGHGQTIFTATTAIVVLTVGKLTVFFKSLPFLLGTLLRCYAEFMFTFRSSLYKSEIKNFTFYLVPSP